MNHLSVDKKRVVLKRGFTLIELLVVMTLIGILAIVGVASYSSSMMRGRDAKRKGDLKNIAEALELYWADYERYPLSDGGKIQICQVFSPPTGCVTLGWGGSTAFDDRNHPSTVYMKLVPRDPSVDQNYFYSIDSAGKDYKLWARLEIGTDPDIITSATSGCGAYAFPVCRTVSGECNYGRSSSAVALCDGGW